MTAQGYHVLQITCRDRTDRHKTYLAGLIDQHRKEGWLCIFCRELVPHDGNEIHDVRKAGRSP